MRFRILLLYVPVFCDIKAQVLQTCIFFQHFEHCQWLDLGFDISVYEWLKTIIDLATRYPHLVQLYAAHYHHLGYGSGGIILTILDRRRQSSDQYGRLRLTVVRLPTPANLGGSLTGSILRTPREMSWIAIDPVEK